MKKTLLAMCVAFATAFVAKADEGMWLLPLIQKLNIQTMQQMGCRLTAEDIYSVNHSSLKDAVVIFDNGCTGEIVSDKGLIFTNHHCGYSAIQKLSSVEHNYLADGFWAKSFDEELPVSGLKVQFLRRMEDVTDRVLEGTESLGSVSAARDSLVDRNISKVLAEVDRDEFVNADVESYFNGNQYFLVVYDVYTDVRLVGTPPESIGKFGHDTDNWMWPRHTGDFSVFRVYADADGRPARYSADNRPFKPRHYLPISLKGVEPGDYAMTIGFPGSTDRYLTSWGIEQTCDENSVRIVARGLKQDIWMADMQADPKVSIMYASKYARSSNYWKNSIGMNRGIKRLHVLDRKRAIESEFEKWAADKPEYANVLHSLRQSYHTNLQYNKVQQYIVESFYGGIEIYRFASQMTMQRLVTALGKRDAHAVDSLVARLRTAADAFYKDYSPATDRKLTAAMLKLYADSVESRFYPSFFDVLARKYKNDYERYSADLFAKSIFASRERFMAMLDKPTLKAIENDPAYQHGVSIVRNMMSIYDATEHAEALKRSHLRLFLKGLMEMKPDKVFYSDANFTMRLSYGTVADYESADAVHYRHFTTIKGIMEKEDPNNWEFNVAPKLRQLYEASDYGRYADKDGTLHVCFITTNDITGGNSGSPVINGSGQLIGLAFDGNWEAMSGDIIFEPELQRCICVDIRYVLFVIEKFGGATNLIDELKIEA